MWRRYRDFFYVENMHGYDWNSLLAQYRPLVDFVAHRSDLNYVLGEMVAEFSVSHAYLQGGDFEIPKRPEVALPGARIELDSTAGRYRVTKIYLGQNQEDLYRSPLTEVGVDVKEGDYILTIDGEGSNPQGQSLRILRNKANRPVQWTVNSKRHAGRFAHHHLPPHHQRNKLDLPRLDYAQPRRRFQSYRRQGWLHSSSGHGRRRHP